jgi:hypothetical protein
MPAPPSQSNAAGETAAAHPFRAGMRLETRVVLRFSAAVALGLVILFVPAGSFHFWQGWLYLGLVLGPTLGAFVYSNREFPRLCRGGSNSLTFSGVHPRNSKR